MTMTHKEMTKHVRGRLKHHGIKASVRMYTACGISYISVSEPKYGAGLTEFGTIRALEIASVNRLTTAQRGDVKEFIALAKEHNWNHSGFNFEYHQDLQA